MPDYTDSVALVGKVLAEVALTDSSEKSYEFTKNASQRTIQGFCGANDWLYAFVSGGPYFIVPAATPFGIKLMSNPQTIYLKRSTADATVSFFVSH